jgi:hypothetical protein
VAAHGHLGASTYPVGGGLVMSSPPYRWPWWCETGRNITQPLDDGSAVLEDAPDAEGSTAPARGCNAEPADNSERPEKYARLDDRSRSPRSRFLRFQ